MHLSLTWIYLNIDDPLMSSISKRSNYDIQRVYLYKKNFVSLFSKKDDILKVDTRDLLHILNFWNNHMCNVHEDTYRPSVKALKKCGIFPRPWSQPLQHFTIDQFPDKWTGFYSCLHPEPKSLRDLQNKQSCAEIWDEARPFSLRFSKTVRPGKCWWPSKFEEIPVFQGRHEVGGPKVYLRGTAKYLDLGTGKTQAKKPAKSAASPRDEGIIKWSSLIGW